MKVIQKSLKLKSRGRGFHIISGEIENALPELRTIKAGLAHLHILHTSAGLTINENADPTVRSDFETFFSRLVPEDPSLYQHTYEGLDDMTSHIKSSLLGASVTIPVTVGRCNLGTWPGVYLCEYRDRPRSRSIIITIIGEEK